MKKGIACLASILFAVLVLCTPKVDASAIEPATDTLATPVTPVQPAKLTNVAVDEYGLLRWNEITGVAYYDVSISDGSNQYYAKATKSGSTYNLSYYQVLNADAKTELTLDFEKLIKSVYLGSASTGLSSTRPEANKTYTVYVRAVNVGLNAAGTVTETAKGPWSDAIVYKYKAINPAEVIAIKDFAYVSFDKTNRRLYFGAPSVAFTEASSDSFRMQFSFDANFTTSKTLSLTYSESMGYFYTSADWARYSGFTMYCRLYDDDYRTANGEKAYSNTINFVVPTYSDNTVTALSNLVYSDKLYDGCVTFMADKVLDTDETFVVERATDTNFKTGLTSYETTASTGYLSVNLSSMEENVTYYFRAKGKKSTKIYVWNNVGETVSDFKNRMQTAYGTSSVESVFGRYLCIISKTIDGAYSNTVSYTKASTCTAVKNLAVEYRDEYCYFTFNSNDLKADEYIQLNYSTKNDFPAGRDSSGDLYCYTRTFSHADSIGGKVYLQLNAKSWYVRARVLKSESGYSSGANTSENYFVGAWSNTVLVKPEVGNTIVSFRDVDSSSVTIRATTSLGLTSGTEIQMKEGSSYKRIYKGEDSCYKVTGLKSNTAYTFKVRKYYYYAARKAYTYGPWTEASVFTWGSALNVKAEASSTKAVAISWTPVNGANGYEIYRYKSCYSSSVTGFMASYGAYTYNNKSFNQMELIKTVGSSTKSYTDSGLASNNYYYYTVRAYKSVGSKKYYVSDSDYTYLGFKTMNITKESQASSGKVTVEWKKVAGAKKYIVEKYNANKRCWEVYKSTTKNSIELPKCTPTEASKYDRYRVYASKSSKYTSYSDEIYVYPFLEAPKSVKAKVLSDGSVEITWKAVAGADYYVVYKSRSSYQVYYPEMKGYEYANVIYFDNAKADSKATTGYSIIKVGKNTSTVAYDAKIEGEDRYGVKTIYSEGPQMGTNYYFVAAYKYVDAGATYSEMNNSSIRSPYSDCAVVEVTANDISKPVVTLSTKSGKVTVKWKKVGGSGGYEIYRSTKKSSGYKLVKTVTSGKTTSFTDSSVSKGKKYYYKVRALVTSKTGASGYTKYSDIKAITVK